MAQAVEYQPLVLVETADLSREEWLAYRRQGLGGSDAAAVLGISPFRTAVDLYYDKRNLGRYERRRGDDESNVWVSSTDSKAIETYLGPSDKKGYEAILEYQQKQREEARIRRYKKETNAFLTVSPIMIFIL